MQYRLKLQDPSSADTQYLYESLVEELSAPYTVSFEAVFAFASRNGVAELLQDVDFHAFMDRGGRAVLVVGIDAVTNQGALVLLQEICARWENLDVRVFHNDVCALFHPKLARFTRADGSIVMIVGSGNLTPGGLRGNIEAYASAEISAAEIGLDASVASFDTFLERHAGRIRVIDDEALARAALNVMRRGRRVSGTGGEAESPEAEIAVAEEAAELTEEESFAARHGGDRVLVAQVPSGGGRWNQVHFNKKIVEDFFRMTPTSSDRAFLYEVSRDGTQYTAEPPRKMVYSEVNRNHKLEFAAHHGEEYPAIPPILVVREVGHHTFVYRMLLHGEPGYANMNTLLSDKPILGRGPTRRTIVDADEIKSYWPESPV